MDERALDTALEYARRGWPVLPCHAPTPYGRCSCGHHQCSSIGKHPRLQHGLREASSDESAVSRWWARWPDANVAVLTGSVSGLVVLDVDRRHGGDRTLEALVARHGRLPRTATVQTGDGVHLYFAHPGQRIGNDSGQRLGRGLDVRGDGGYVLAPPSLHASGRRYLRLEPMNFIAPLPTWMIEELTRERITPSPSVNGGKRLVNGDASAWARTALEGEVQRVCSAVEGTRNITLNRAAFSLGQIVASGLLDRGAVETELADAAHRVGLSDRETKLTIQSGLDAGSRTPRAPASQEPRREPIAIPTTDEPVAAVELVHWPKDFEGPSFAAGGEYVERCWTGVLGPTGVLMLRDLAQRLQSETSPVHVNLDELGRALGVGHQGGRNSVLNRTMSRLERYGMAMALPDGTLAIRTDIPPLPGAAVRRAAPRVAEFHRDQLASLNHWRAPTR